jgi:hypothetical protein
MADPFRACAGVCSGQFGNVANLGSTFTLRLIAAMLVTETKKNR